MQNDKVNFMRKLFIIATFIFIAQITKAQNMHSIEYHNDSIERSKEYKEGNSFQKDFLLFIDMLETTHPAFSIDMSSPFNIDSLKSNGYKDLKFCKSSSELAAYLQEISALHNDGHTGMISSKNSLVYPVSFFNDGNNYYITAISKKEKAFLGKRIIAVNGTPINIIIKDFCSEVSAENKVGKEREVRNQAFRAWKYWENKSYVRKDSLMTLQVEDGSEISLHLTKNFFNDIVTLPKKLNVIGQTIRSNDDVPFSCKTDSALNIAYLQFNKCEDQFFTRWMAQQQGITLTKEQEDYISGIPSFHEFLRNFFENIRKKNISNLVIDMRDNFGGNSILCSELLSWLSDVNKGWLIPTPYIRPSRLYCEFYKNQYKEIYDKITANYASVNYNQLYNAITGKTIKEDCEGERETLNSFPEDFRILFNTDTDKIFKGNIYFIQNDNTFSSAADMILMAYDNNIGKVVGGHSSYLTSHFGDILIYSLPNTHFVGYVSHKYFLRPNRNRVNEKEIIPDPLIERSWNDVLNDNDPCWIWIKNKLDINGTN